MAPLSTPEKPNASTLQHALTYNHLPTLLCSHGQRCPRISVVWMRKDGRASIHTSALMTDNLRHPRTPQTTPAFQHTITEPHFTSHRPSMKNHGVTVLSSSFVFTFNHLLPSMCRKVKRVPIRMKNTQNNEIANSIKLYSFLRLFLSSLIHLFFPSFLPSPFTLFYLSSLVFFCNSQFRTNLHVLDHG